MLHKVKFVTAKGTGKKAINRQDESHAQTEAALKRWRPALTSLLAVVVSNEQAWSLLFQSYTNLQTSAEAIYSKSDHDARGCLRALQDGRARVNPGPPDSAGVALKHIAQVKHDIKALLVRITNAEHTHKKRFEASRQHTYYKGKAGNIAQKEAKTAKNDTGCSNKSHKGLGDYANELNKLTAQLYSELEEIDRERLRVADRAVCAVVNLQDFYYSSNPARGTKEKCEKMRMGARAIPRDEAKSWLQLQPPNVSSSSIMTPQPQTGQQMTPSPTVQHPYPQQAFSVSGGSMGYLQPPIQHVPSGSSISSAPAMSSLSSVPSPMQHSGHPSPVSSSHHYSPNGYHVTPGSQGNGLPPTQQVSPGSSTILTPPAVSQGAAQPPHSQQQPALLQTATQASVPLQQPAQPQYSQQQPALHQTATQASAPLQQPAQPQYSQQQPALLQTATQASVPLQQPAQPQYSQQQPALLQTATQASAPLQQPAQPQYSQQQPALLQTATQASAPLQQPAQPQYSQQQSAPHQTATQSSASLQQPAQPATPLQQTPQPSALLQYGTRPYTSTQNGLRPYPHPAAPYVSQPYIIPQPTPQPSAPHQYPGQFAAPLHSMALPPSQYQQFGPPSAQLQESTRPSVPPGQPTFPQHPAPMPTHPGQPVQPSNLLPQPVHSTAPVPQPSQWPARPKKHLQSHAPPQQPVQQSAPPGKPFSPFSPPQGPQPPAPPGYPTTCGPAQHPTRVTSQPMYPPNAYSAGFNPAVQGYPQPPVPSAAQPFGAQSAMPPAHRPVAPPPPQPQHFMQPRPPSM